MSGVWGGVLRILRSMLMISIILAVWSSFTGSLLAKWEAKLEHNPGLAALLPVLMAAAGAAAASFGSRLSTHLHLGTFTVWAVLRDALVQGSALMLVIAGYAGLVTVAFSGRPSLILLAVESTGLTFLTSTLVALGSAFTSVRLGMDPDDVVGPIVTTAADSVGIILALTLAPG
ncbi:MULTISPECIES: magnesium transporter [unclassified Methanopyrus]|uniref:magnesium transporter n=1 Tax=unclassified Methanopyrus TaxID=2684913 RepID=UPI000B4C09EC|nr:MULTISPECIES: magnesium transporter [unclassified Methanopyrus]